MAKKKTILVAPLHWGLGHATRCIPIIKSLLDCDFNVILASDGAALLLLQKEFPKLESIELPSYNITYPKKGKGFKWNIFLKFPKILKVISSEKKIIEKLVSKGKINGIISDNRFGIRNKNIPSVYITHQLNVISGSTTYFSSKSHQNIIKKFDECWIPDFEGSDNLSGVLGHPSINNLNLKYIGILSRMKKINLYKKYDILLLLSGPEPQRTLLEEIFIEEFKGKKQSVLLIQGCIENYQKINQKDNIVVYNFMESKELEQAINESEIVVSRSGYTTIMDLVTLEKKAFLIPTPGQFEQEYLANRIKDLKMAPFCKQKEFRIEKIEEISLYKGFKSHHTTNEFKNLFSLFEGK